MVLRTIWLGIKTLLDWNMAHDIGYCIDSWVAARAAHLSDVGEIETLQYRWTSTHDFGKKYSRGSCKGDSMSVRALQYVLLDHYLVMRKCDHITIILT